MSTEIQLLKDPGREPSDKTLEDVLVLPLGALHQNKFLFHSQNKCRSLWPGNQWKD